LRRFFRADAESVAGKGGLRLRYLLWKNKYKQ